MIGYIEAREIVDNMEAADALNEIRQDMHGLVQMLLALGESRSEVDPAVLALAHNIALAIGNAVDTVFPIAEAALMAEQDVERA